MKDKKYCIGCGANYYNGNNPMGVKECWGYESAKIIKMFCIGWWTPQDRKENFTEVKTHNCHTETGNQAFYNKLPAHLS